MAVADIIAEPAMYGGYKVPVKGFDFDADSFTDGTVQALYEAYKADPTDENAQWAVGGVAHYKHCQRDIDPTFDRGDPLVGLGGGGRRRNRRARH